MKKTLPVFFFCLCISSPLFSQEKVFPLSQIKENMRIYGKTVYKGRKPTLFTGRVEGVININSAPGEILPDHVVMIKIRDKEEGRYAGIGNVFGGMSGSPIYDKDPFKHKDAKEIGALSIGFGNEPVESIAGITPLEEMLKLFDDYRESPLSEINARASSYGQRPALTMLVDGLSEKIVAPFLSKLAGNTGIQFKSVAMPIGKASPEQIPNSRTAPEPGEMFVALLIDGDGIRLGAGCTVTYIDESRKRFLGCGHAIAGLGHVVGYPVYSAYTVKSLKDRRAPTKVLGGIASEPFGAIENDRFVGVAGTIGAIPQMIPVSIHIKSGAHETNVNAKVAQYASSVDLLTLVLLKGLLDVGDISSARLMVMKGQVVVRGRRADGSDSVRTLSIDRVEDLPSQVESFFGSETVPKENIVYKNASDIIDHVFKRLLTAPPNMNICFDKVKLDLELLNNEGGFSKESLKISDEKGNKLDHDFFSPSHPKIKRGENISVVVTIKNLYGTENYTSKLDVQIPKDAELGTARLVIADGNNLQKWLSADRARSTDRLYRDGFDGLMDKLIETNDNNKVIYVRLQLSPSFTTDVHAQETTSSGWMRVNQNDGVGRELIYQFQELSYPVDFDFEFLTFDIVDK